MPNVLMMRWVLAAAVALAAALVLAIIWQSAPSGIGRVSGSPGISDPRDFARRQDELSFLQAAFDRLDAEARQDPNGPASRSLRVQQESILLRMREVARPLPAESLPRALRAPVKGEARASSEPVPSKGSAEAGRSPAAPPELKVGLGASSSAPDLALARDPALNLIILIARPRPPRPASEAVSDNSAEPHAANPDAKSAARARTAEKAAERAAERAAARPPAAGSAGFTEPPRSEPATASR
jgi:hypothetical protein